MKISYEKLALKRQRDGLVNSWWVSLGGEVLENPQTLQQVRQLVTKSFGPVYVLNVHDMHRTDPEWVELTLYEPAPARVAIKAEPFRPPVVVPVEAPPQEPPKVPSPWDVRAWSPAEIAGGVLGILIPLGIFWVATIIGRPENFRVLRIVLANGFAAVLFVLGVVLWLRAPRGENALEWRRFFAAASCVAALALGCYSNSDLLQQHGFNFPAQTYLRPVQSSSEEPSDAGELYVSTSHTDASASKDKLAADRARYGLGYAWKQSMASRPPAGSSGASAGASAHHPTHGGRR